MVGDYHHRARIGFHGSFDELTRIPVYSIGCLGKESFPGIPLGGNLPIVVHAFARVKHGEFTMAFDEVVRQSVAPTNRTPSSVTMSFSRKYTSGNRAAAARPFSSASLIEFL